MNTGYTAVKYGTPIHTGYGENDYEPTYYTTNEDSGHRYRVICLKRDQVAAQAAAQAAYQVAAQAAAQAEAQAAAQAVAQAAAQAEYDRIDMGQYNPFDQSDQSDPLNFMDPQVMGQFDQYDPFDPFNQSDPLNFLVMDPLFDVM